MRSYELYATYNAKRYIRGMKLDSIVREYLRPTPVYDTKVRMHVISTGAGYVLTAGERLDNQDCMFHIGTVVEHNDGHRDYYPHIDQLSMDEFSNRGGMR